MCGIVGFAQTPARSGAASPHHSDALPHAGESGRDEILRRMTDALIRRGPDASGRHISGGVALGHRRLSIIDASGGAQPMHSADGNLTVVFNGEIYNYLELNSDLASQGYRAHSRSDTETLLNAYACWGDACVEKFNGMFAFVIHDRKNKRLFGARDRLGKKPLYYAHSASGDFFAFASEPKALLPAPGVARRTRSARGRPLLPVRVRARTGLHL